MAHLYRQILAQTLAHLCERLGGGAWVPATGLDYRRYAKLFGQPNASLFVQANPVSVGGGGSRGSQRKTHWVILLLDKTRTLP